MERRIIGRYVGVLSKSGISIGGMAWVTVPVKTETISDANFVCVTFAL